MLTTGFVLIKITSVPLHPEPIVNSIRKDDNGAIITFIGTVRNTSQDGNKVTFLEIAPRGKDAEAKLKEVETDICQKWQLQDIAIYRRVGRLKVGEIALVVAISAPHRQEAFQACQYAVDMIKQGKITTEKDIYETSGSPTRS